VGWFKKPTNQVKDFIGIEIEIPIINLDKKAVDFDVVHKITNEFKNYYSDFKEDGIDYEGNVFSLKIQKPMILSVMTAHTIILNLQGARKKTCFQSMKDSQIIIHLQKSCLSSTIIL
jgi:hypothetical protein